MIKKLLFYSLVFIFLPTNYVIAQILHNDSIYRIQIDTLSNIEENQNLLNLRLTYYIGNYSLLVSLKNGSIDWIAGYEEEFGFIGTTFKLNDCSSIKYVNFNIFGIESGPHIVFYDNFLIKSVYNYGFSMDDLKLPIKQYHVYDTTEFFIMHQTRPYYKEKNGFEYFYTYNGEMEKIVEFRDGIIISTKYF